MSSDIDIPGVVAYGIMFGLIALALIGCLYNPLDAPDDGLQYPMDEEEY